MEGVQRNLGDFQLFLSIILVFFLTDCASAPSISPSSTPQPVEVKEELIERLPDPKPGWVLKGSHPDEGEFLFFVGYSTKHTEERNAVREAKVDATNKFVEYCGIQASVFQTYLETTVGKTSGVLDSEIQAQAQSQQKAEAYVSRVKLVEKYMEKYRRTQGSTVFPNAYKLAVLVKVPRSEYNQVQAWKKQQEEKRRKVVEATMQEHLKNTQSLEGEKNVLAALSELRDAKTYVLSSKASNTSVYMATLEKEEKAIVGRVQIIAIARTTQQTEPNERPEPLEVKVVYQKEQQETPLANFPLIFSTPSHEEPRQTNHEGKVILSLPPSSNEGQLQIQVHPDQSHLKNRISEDALKDVSAKQIVFTIEVRKTKLTELEKVIQTRIPSDFNFRFSSDHKEKTWKIGEEFTFQAQCAKRCHIRIYKLDEKGKFWIWDDSKEVRLPKDRPFGPISLGKATAPGVSQVIVTASTRPFPNQYQPKTQISEAEFLVLLKSFRVAGGEKAESQVTLKIVER